MNTALAEANTVNHPVVSRDRWLAERRALLAREKELRACTTRSPVSAARCPGFAWKRTTSSIAPKARARWPSCSRAAAS
jgi:predicted dithiol-disulfide oxidoreductase (DUF899 family)